MPSPNFVDARGFNLVVGALLVSLLALALCCVTILNTPSSPSRCVASRFEIQRGHTACVMRGDLYSQDGLVSVDSNGRLDVKEPVGQRSTRSVCKTSANTMTLVDFAIHPNGDKTSTYVAYSVCLCVVDKTSFDTLAVPPGDSVTSNKDGVVTTERVLPSCPVHMVYCFAV